MTKRRMDKEDDLDKEDAVGKDVKDLVGQVLSASSNGRPPGCRVDGVVAGEELGVDVLVPPSLRSRTRQDQKTGSSQELRESHPMVAYGCKPSRQVTGLWKELAGKLYQRPSARKLTRCLHGKPKPLESATTTFQRETLLKLSSTVFLRRFLQSWYLGNPKPDL